AIDGRRASKTCVVVRAHADHLKVDLFGQAFNTLDVNGIAQIVPVCRYNHGVGHELIRGTQEAAGTIRNPVDNDKLVIVIEITEFVSVQGIAGNVLSPYPCLPAITTR